MSSQNYNKSDLIKDINKEFKDLRPKDINMIIDLIINYMADALRENRKIEIRDFAVFESRMYASKIGFNPLTKEKIKIPASKNVLFRPSKKIIKEDKTNVI